MNGTTENEIEIYEWEIRHAAMALAVQHLAGAGADAQVLLDLAEDIFQFMTYGIVWELA